MKNLADQRRELLLNALLQDVVIAGNAQFGNGPQDHLECAGFGVGEL